ncbi:hypothetical protein FVE85_5206 [Porphyridium purpureum]|uniref:Uncharacterized protein n=1 Tax=Porphyridium purpureum TaxID=35688 RepID=A0A5J4Z159_PORPP|nr:hypothetical protein FVE85_5206 [Porphyridium purpureum]|eukprot:POR8746..scf295_1
MAAQFPRVVLEGMLGYAGPADMMYVAEDVLADGTSETFRDSYQMRFSEQQAQPPTRPYQPAMSGWTRAMMFVAVAWALMFYVLRFVLLYLYTQVRYAWTKLQEQRLREQEHQSPQPSHAHQSHSGLASGPQQHAHSGNMFQQQVQPGHRLWAGGPPPADHATYLRIQEDVRRCMQQQNGQRTHQQQTR